MKNMEGSGGPRGVLKKKSSSGCLIIKNKGYLKNSGGGLGGGSSVDNKEKKRPKFVGSGSGSSDEDESLEFMRRKVNDKKSRNGSMGYKRNEFEDSEYHRNKHGIEISGDRKRSRLDLYEFDEYDEFDGKKMRNEYVEDRFKMIRCHGVGSSSNSLALEKQKQSSYFDGSGSGRTKRDAYDGLRNKGFEEEEDDDDDDEAHMPISLLRSKYQDKANESIRLQGKNGVLKVMMNKKKNIDFPSQHKNINPREVAERKGSGSEDVPSKDMARLPVYRGLKAPERSNFSVDKEKSVKKEKKEAKMERVKQKLSKDHVDRELEIDGADTSLKLAPAEPEAGSSKKAVKKEVERSAPPQNVTPIKRKEAKESKPKQGGSTEKQMLREKIRAMLIDAGWTIDYRPRRNRDYLDAVYINPVGTAYWSIIKAYDAFKKQLEEDTGKSKLDVSSPSFAPLSDNLIHKLTRRTKKKIEEETKRKRKEDSITKGAKRPAVREDSENSDGDENEEMKQNHKSQRVNSHGVDGDSEDDLSDDLPRRKPKKVKGDKASIASGSNTLQGKKSETIGRRTLLVRGSDRGGDWDSDGYVPYSGKRTVLGWLIDSGTAQLSEKLQYMNRKRTRVMLEGWITREGIHCGCCSKILSVSKFELHAGSKLRQPFQNIYLESGPSLLQCQLDAWNRQEESVRRVFHDVDIHGDDPDDDTCGICGDGGDLICCDSCPSTFHQICLGIQMLPSGDWHCPNCACKFCGDSSGNVAAENEDTVDQLIKCCFCEKKYHKSCAEGASAPPVTPNGTSFCGMKCQELYDHLQKIIGVKHELEAGFSWSLIQRTDVSDTSLRGYHQRVECNSKLAVALSVMDECFLPIIDRRSGINMIQSVVYNCGSNFNRLNYGGFHTIILERGDEIISAACIRIHGTHIAEMPFIGTREIYRRQGMCRRLFSAIETELCSLKVRHLVIPAISEHMNTWTTIFGFHQLEDELKKEIKSMNMLVFPGTDMLQKQLVVHENSHEPGMKVIESNKNQPQVPEKSDIDPCPRQKEHGSGDSGVCLETKINDDFNGQELCSPLPPVPTNDNKSAGALDSGCEPDTLLPCKQTTVDKSEVENMEKEAASSDSKDLHTSGLSNNTIDMENGSLNSPANSNPASEIIAPSGATLSPDEATVKENPNPSVLLSSVKEASSDSKDLHTSCLSNNTIDMENGLLNPSANDNHSSGANASKFVAPSGEILSPDEPVKPSILESAEVASIWSNVGSAVRVSGNTDAKIIVDNGLVESPSTAAVETSEAVNGEHTVSLPESAAVETSEAVNGEHTMSLPESAAIETSEAVNGEHSVSLPESGAFETSEAVNGEHSVSLPKSAAIETSEAVNGEHTVSLPKSAVEEHPLDLKTELNHPTESEDNSLVESTFDSVATGHSNVTVVTDTVEPASCDVNDIDIRNETSENVEVSGIQLPSGSSAEVPDNFASETTNKDQTSVPISTSSDAGECRMTCSAEVDHNDPDEVKNELGGSGVVHEAVDPAVMDNPDGQIKISSVNDAKVVPIVPSEVLAQSREDTENHTESLGCANINSPPV